VKQTHSRNNFAPPPQTAVNIVYCAEIIVGRLLPSHHYRSGEKKRVGMKLGNDTLFIGHRKIPLGTE